MARPSRNSYTAYALRNYSQKDVLNVQVTEVSARLEMVWLEQPNKFGRLIWLPNLVAVNEHFSNYSVISNCE